MENQGNNMNYYGGIGIRTPIIIRPNPITAIMQLLNNIDNIDDVITESMESKDKKKPMCKEYRSKLIERDINDTDISESLSCAICQEEFKIGEKALELPCKDGSHFFHTKNDDECPGIYPWIDEKNTCPVCRAEFPYEEVEPEPESEPEPEPESGQGEEEENEEEGDRVPIIPLLSSNITNIPFANNTIIQEPVRLINPRGNIIQNILGEAMEQAFQEIEDQELNEAIRRSLED